jgi:ribosomal protein L9
MTNIEAILVGLLSVTHTREQAEHAARTVLRDHAHQLAEKIRQDAQARHDRDFSDNRIFRLTGAQAAADLAEKAGIPVRRFTA